MRLQKDQKGSKSVSSERSRQQKLFSIAKNKKYCYLPPVCLSTQTTLHLFTHAKSRRYLRNKDKRLTSASMHFKRSNTNKCSKSKDSFHSWWQPFFCQYAFYLVYLIPSYITEAYLIVGKSEPFNRTSHYDIIWRWIAMFLSLLHGHRTSYPPSLYLTFTRTSVFNMPVL